MSCQFVFAKQDTITVISLIKKSNNFLYLNNDSSDYYLDKAILLSQNNKDQNSEILCLLEYARHNIVRGHYLEAYKYCSSSADLAKKNNISEYDFKIKMYTGLIYSNMGLYSEGLKVLLETQRLDSSNTVNSDQKSELDYYTAKTYFEIGEYKQGMKYIRSSMLIATINKDTLGCYISYSLLTNLLQNQDSLQKYFKLCENILSNKPEMKYEKVVFNINKAMTMIDLGDLKTSKRLYLEAIKMAETGNFDKYLMTLYNNYAYQLMYESSDDNDSILNYLDKALNIAVKLNSLEAQAETYDSYSDYYNRIGDYKNSLKYSKLYIEKSNEFREQKKLEETRFLSAVFENEKKENALLKQENEISRLWLYIVIAISLLIFVIGISLYFRQRWALSKSKLDTTIKTKQLEIAEAKIQGQDAERDRLGMDLHDGVVADLSSLKMRLQSSFKENKDFDSINHILNTIIQNLRGLSHRMRPASLEEYGLIPSIQDLVYTVNQSGKFKVTLNCDFDERLSQNVEVSIYFLIYELVNNATKYSKGDTIDIQLYKDEQYINLSVEDNGGDFKNDNVSKGQGLKNIKDRLTQLGGEIVIDSHEDATAFIINIPIEK